MNSKELSFPDNHILVAAPGRSGQTWLCMMLSYMFNAYFAEPYCLLRGIIHTGNEYVIGNTNGQLPGKNKTNIHVIVKTHEFPDPEFSLTRNVVLLMRDPRDAVTSTLFRFATMKSLGSDIEEDAKNYSIANNKIQRRKTLKRFIWEKIYFNRYLCTYFTARKWSRYYETWSSLDFCHIIRYEDLKKDPLKELIAIQKLAIDEIDPDLAKATIEKFSFEKLSGRKEGESRNASISFRKGTVGDFKKNLNSFQQLIIRKVCGPTANKHGYEL